MRVAITDYFAAYTYASATPARGGVLHPSKSLSDSDLSAAELSDPFFCARHLIERAALDGARLGLVCGSSKGDLRALPLWDEEARFEWTPDFFASHLARQLQLSGPVLSPNAACATAAHALALGAAWIEAGRADVVLAGAVEWPQTPLVLAAYRNMKALSKSGIMRPFDVRRDGFLPASGFGLLMLESEARARQRNAPIHGFLTGYALKCDAYHLTAMNPSGQGIARAIESALEMAGQPKIDYINAHGTATQNDLIEARAIHAVFGASVPISSTKPQTGHLLGASGAIEAAICLGAMRENFAPPTLNLETEANEFGLDFLPRRGREMSVGATLNLNYGFGGQIGALIFEKS